MDIELGLEGSQATEATVLALQDWVRRERIAGLRVQRKRQPHREGEMGVDPGTMLSIVLGSGAVIELVKCIHTWLQERKPKCKIRLKTADYELEIDAENLPDQQTLVQRVVTLTNPMRR